MSDEMKEKVDINITLAQIHLLVPGYLRQTNYLFPDVLMDVTIDYSKSDLGFYAFCCALERKANDAHWFRQILLDDMHIITDLRTVIGDANCLTLNEDNIKNKMGIVKGIEPVIANILFAFWKIDVSSIFKRQFVEHVIEFFNMRCEIIKMAATFRDYSTLRKQLMNWNVHMKKCVEDGNLDDIIQLKLFHLFPKRKSPKKC
eukprot:415660_1